MYEVGDSPYGIHPLSYWSGGDGDLLVVQSIKGGRIVNVDFVTGRGLSDLRNRCTQPTERILECLPRSGYNTIGDRHGCDLL